MSAQEQAELRTQYLRAVFDAIPLPAFIVDSDVRIHDFNTAAEPLLGSDPGSLLCCRSGEALHCIHSEAAGCGEAVACEDCVIRNSVNRAAKGVPTYRELHHAHLRGPQGVVPVDFLVTTNLLPYTASPRALLILEDISVTIRTSRSQGARPEKFAKNASAKDRLRSRTPI